MKKRIQLANPDVTAKDVKLHEGQIVCILPGDCLLINGGRCGMRLMRVCGGVSVCLCLVSARAIPDSCYIHMCIGSQGHAQALIRSTLAKSPWGHECED